jgi:hypothetical protein
LPRTQGQVGTAAVRVEVGGVAEQGDVGEAAIVPAGLGFSQAKRDKLLFGGQRQELRSRPAEVFSCRCIASSRASLSSARSSSPSSLPFRRRRATRRLMVWICRRM